MAKLNQKQKLDILIINRDADTINECSEQIMEAFESITPKLNVKRISDPYLDVAKEKYLSSEKLLFLIESETVGLKANLIQTWINEMPGNNNDPTNYMVIFRCPNNEDDRKEYLAELSAVGLTREQFVFINDFGSISSWWPQVIKFSLNVKETIAKSMTLVQSEDNDEQSNKVRTEMVNMLKAFDITLDKSPFGTAGHLLIFHKGLSPNEHLKGSERWRYFESKSAENVHMFYASDAPVPEEIKPQTDSVHKENELLKGLLFILVDMNILQAKRHKSVNSFRDFCSIIKNTDNCFVNVILLVLKFILALPILCLNSIYLVWISYLPVVSFGALLWFSEQCLTSYRKCAGHALFVITLYPVVLCFYFGDGISDNAKMSFLIFHALLFVQNFIVFCFPCELNIFHLPHKLWPKVGRGCLPCLKYRAVVGHPIIFLVIVVVLNIPIMLCMLVVCCMFPLYVLSSLCYKYENPRLKKLKLISHDIHTALIFSAFYTVPAMILYYQTPGFPYIIVGCTLLTVDMFVWMYMVGHMVNKEYDCEYGVLSLPYKIYESRISSDHFILQDNESSEL